LRFFLLVILTLSFAHAKSAYENGKNLYMQKGCYSCHGIKADGMNTYPMLANRAKGFLSYKLKRFREKISENQQQELMIPFSLDLSDEDIENLTTFLYEFKENNEGEKYDDSFRHWGGGS
jgi:cytochrome c553